MELSWSINLPVDHEKLYKVAIDFENYVNYLPAQIKKISIIEKNDDTVTTEESLSFQTILKKEFSQRTIHDMKQNSITSTIVSGPFKNSKVTVNFSKIEIGSKVLIDAHLKIPLKYKVFSLVIKKVYKNYLTSILYKMMNQVQQ